ncbi:hypothetical protein Naga_100055g17 [Nannochloropsis gaditana]|uniref:Uncharacterized protein n=1 Tax=Nannochloropsis gaditana TaxID=72520 RepID=W7TCB3_9STRA|nr:hypothetical protein Naga_100055g17 [Nannochloropsis gaditana]
MAERVVLFHVFDHILLLRCCNKDILPDVVFLFWAFTVHVLRSPRRHSPGVRHLCAVDFASITSFGREAVAVQVASVGDTSVVRTSTATATSPADHYLANFSMADWDELKRKVRGIENKLEGKCQKFSLMAQSSNGDTRHDEENPLLQDSEELNIVAEIESLLAAVRDLQSCIDPSNLGYDR